jgi:uncharacterized protein
MTKPIVLLILLWTALPVWAQQAVPTLTGRVVDTANVLSEGTEEMLTVMLAAHEDSTSNQVAVLTVPSLGGEAIEDFSLRVAETWGLGQAATDNGVLLLVAVEDREMRIEVGYGLEGSLTDAAAGGIIRNEIAPEFRNGDYDAGVLAGVQSILGTIEGTYTPSDAGSDFSGDSPPFWFGLIFLFFPTLFLMPTIFQPWYVRLFLFLFLIPFIGVGGWALTGRFMGAVVFVAIYAGIVFLAGLHPKVRKIQKKVKAASKTGDTVKVGPFTIGGASSSSGGGWSSGGGSSFSGGGGSFGGGGASGGW